MHHYCPAVIFFLFGLVWFYFLKLFETWKIVRDSADLTAVPESNLRVENTNISMCPLYMNKQETLVSLSVVGFLLLFCFYDFLRQSFFT